MTRPRPLDSAGPGGLRGRDDRARGELGPFLRRFIAVFAALGLLLAGGTVAYVLSEGVSVWDGFLWSLDTVATEGARNRPDTVAGEITWVALIVLGVGTLLYALVTLVELFVAGHLRILLDERREQHAIDALSDHVIICGFGRVGRQVAQDLRAAGERYVVIDGNPEHADDARHVGVRFIEGSASDDEALIRAGVARARAVIACVDSDAENVFIALTARQLNADVAIVARASRPESESKLQRAGATRVISPYRTSGTEMARAALTPQVSGAMDVTPEYRLEEIEVEVGSSADGRVIADVRGEAIIVGLRHADGSFLPQPSGSTGLRAGDVLLALGLVTTLVRLEGALGPQPGVARS